jgi:hypothetical protein
MTSRQDLLKSACEVRGVLTATGFVWQSTAGTFEVAWDSLANTIRRETVTVLALKNSRAIVVLPDELLTSEAKGYLQKVEHL